MRLTRLLQPVLFPFAKRFVAGANIDRTVSHVQTLNKDGITAMIDLLGEHITRKPAAENALTEYVKLLDRIEEEDIDAALSIKLTHLGLEIGEDYCRSNVHHLVDHAAEHDTFLWVDMESSRHTDETIALYKELREVHDNVGICLQGYLKRTTEDLQDLLEHDGIIRLVKGAYNESDELTYDGKETVREQYKTLLEQLFSQDTYFAVATHDKQLLEYAQTLEKEYGKDRDRFEFQFLMGVRDKMEREIVTEGYTVSEYVPYGPDWLPYYWRRIREREANIAFPLKSAIHSVLGK